MTMVEQSVEVLEERLERLMQEYVTHLRDSGRGTPEDEVGLRELVIMDLLSRKGPCKMNDIATFIGVAMSTATGIVDRMTRRGWVARERSEDDRRVVHVTLAPAGRELFQTIKDLKRDFHRALLDALDESDRCAFLDILQKLANNVHF